MSYIKHFIIISLLCLFSSVALANGKAVDFNLSNGMKVIFLPVPDNEFVSLQIMMPGSALRQTEKNAGIEKLLLSSLNKGSVNFPKAKVDKALDSMGSYIFSSTNKDYSTFKMASIRPYFKKTLDIFADAYKNPLLMKDEVELVRQRQLASIKAKLDHPESVLGLSLNDVFYNGHPYHNTPDGTLESVSAITIKDLDEYSKSLVRYRCHFIVVVGNLKLYELKKHLEQAFGSMKKDLVMGNTYPEFNPPQEFVSKNMEIPTKYIIGKFPAPAPQSPEYAALEIGLKVMAYRLWEVIRTNHGLSYAAFCGLSDNFTNYGYLYMNTINETKALPLMMNEVERMKTELVPEKELFASKQVYTTEYYKDIENNNGLAWYLGYGEMYLNGFEKRDSIISKIRQVDPQMVQNVMKKYLKDFTFGVVGASGQIDTAAFPKTIKAEETKTDM